VDVSQQQVRLAPSTKTVIWTIIAVVAAYAFLGVLAAGVGLVVFAILRKSLTRSQRRWILGVGVFSILYGLVFSMVPWWLVWLYSTPLTTVTHG